MGPPFWYQAHNGLTTRDQAHQIQTYYRRATLPWYAKSSSHSGPQHPARHTTSQATPPEAIGPQGAQPVIDLCLPSTPLEAAPSMVAHIPTDDPIGSHLPTDPTEAPLPKVQATNQP